MTNNYFSKVVRSATNGFVLLLLFFFSEGIAQNDYSVSPIPFQQYIAELPVEATIDDMYSVVPLTFDFDFFGNVYNQAAIGTNGVIDFTPGIMTDALCPWAFTTTIPDADFPIKNSFLGCYHDMNGISGQGTITYAVEGSAPYRRFIVIFDNQYHFSCNQLAISTFQMILYETLNFMDVQIVDKQVCETWNGGVAVIGVINDSGNIAIAAPGRNTSIWTAFHEGWRFQRPLNVNNYNYTKCDADADGIETFNLVVAQSGLWPANPSSVSFYATEAEAMSQTNPLALNYTNVAAGQEIIYANISGDIKSVTLRAIDCSADYDSDTVNNSAEDLNGDGNLANDDTDADGIPNFIDNDDDGDLVLTNEEYVFADKGNASPNAILDTDNDGIPNYLDNDDDGDGTLTIYEDYNGNNNPMDDDTNGDGNADYLDSTVVLTVSEQQQQFTNTISLYPNPAYDVLNIDNRTAVSISNLAIYSINGMLVKEVKQNDSLTVIPVSDLQSGIYFVKIQAGETVLNYKFIKK